MSFLILITAAITTAVISGIVGMAGGVILQAIMLTILPATIIVPIHGAVQLVSNSSRTLFLARHVHKPIALYFLIGTPIGAYIGYKLLLYVHIPEWILLASVGMLLYIAFKPKRLPLIHIPFWAFLPLGIIISGLANLIGATGPLQAPFFIRDDLSKEEIVATKAACQTITHLSKIPTYIALSFNYADYASLIIFLSIGVIIGTKIGVTLLKKIDREKFMIIIKIACVLLSVRVLFKLLYV